MRLLVACAARLWRRRDVALAASFRVRRCWLVAVNKLNGLRVVRDLGNRRNLHIRLAAACFVVTRRWRLRSSWLRRQVGGQSRSSSSCHLNRSFIMMVMFLSATASWLWLSLILRVMLIGSTGR